MERNRLSYSHRFAVVARNLYVQKQNEAGEICCSGISFERNLCRISFFVDYRQPVFGSYGTRGQCYKNNLRIELLFPYSTDNTAHSRTAGNQKR